MATGQLTDDDEKVLASCRAFAGEIATDVLGLGAGTKLDIPMLQRLVDEAACAPDDDWGLQSLGVALGDILCGAGFHWAASETFGRRDLVVTWRDTGLMISVPVLIQKRVSAGEDCDIAALEAWALRLAAEKDSA